MKQNIAELKTPAARLVVNLDVGHIAQLEFTTSHGQLLRPLHTAPWVHENVSLPTSMPPVDRHLAGDFLCLPFGATGSSVPPHGWTANSPWETLAREKDALHLRLARSAAGATVTKMLRPGQRAPLLYQHHQITGGAGCVPLAHHVMSAMRAGGTLFCSPKRVACTPEQPIVANRHLLRYPTQGTDLGQFPAHDGNSINLLQYPSSGTGHEDFVVLVEREDACLGWTALMRQAEDDIVFVLKNPRELPTTMLWFSNGGRLDAPWSGRHTGVLGIEDGYPGAYAGTEGMQWMQRTGVSPFARLGANDTLHIRHVIGCIPRPPGWQLIRDIVADAHTLRLYGSDANPVTLEFDGRFFHPEKDAQ